MTLHLSPDLYHELLRQHGLWWTVPTFALTFRMVMR